MGVRGKRRNKLTVDERSFVWYVKQDDDSDAYILHVISDDKRFNVQYSLRQIADRRFIVVVGSEFRSTSGSGCWRRYRCPQWESDGTVTPSSVRALIDWSMLPDSNLNEVDAAGLPLPLGGHCEHCNRDIRGMIPIASTVCCYCDHPIAERSNHVG